MNLLRGVATAVAVVALTALAAYAAVALAALLAVFAIPLGMLAYGVYLAKRSERQ